MVRIIIALLFSLTFNALSQSTIGFGGVKLNDHVSKIDSLHDIGLWDKKVENESLGIVGTGSKIFLLPKGSGSKMIFSHSSAFGIESLAVDSVALEHDNAHIQSIIIYTRLFEYDELDSMRRANVMLLISIANVYGKPNDYLTADVATSIFQSIQNKEASMLYRWVIVGGGSPSLVSISIYVEVLLNGSLRYFIKIEPAADMTWVEGVNLFR